MFGCGESIETVVEEIDSIDDVIGTLPKEYLDIIYEASYSGANNPFDVVDLSSKYGKADPIQKGIEVINNIDFKDIDSSYVSEGVSSIIRNALGSDYKIYEVKELNVNYTVFKLTITLQHGYSFKEVTINGTVSKK